MFFLICILIVVLPLIIRAFEKNKKEKEDIKVTLEELKEKIKDIEDESIGK